MLIQCQTNTFPNLNYPLNHNAEIKFTTVSTAFKEKFEVLFNFIIESRKNVI